MSVRGLSLVIISALLTVAANLLMRAGVDRAGGFPAQLKSSISAIIKLLSQPLFDLGCLFYIMASLIWFHIISTQPLSVAYPLLVSLTFVFVTLGAVFIFHESLNTTKIIGITIILIGIFILSGGNYL
jgi:multidrug transporter EmrE-like cation transporter